MNTKTDQLTSLIAALSEREKAKVRSEPEENPLVNHSLKDLAGGAGIAKSADHFPALNMATKVKTTGDDRDVENVEDSPAFQMEAARFRARDEGKVDRSAKRMAIAKRRAATKMEFDKIAASNIKPDQDRMDRAWLIVFHMVGIVTKIAKSKQRWANRLLGSNADDIPQMALEAMALVLAKSSKDLDVLTQAASELGASSRESGRIPGDQLSEEERKERKEIRRARKWLMGMANNRVMGALVDSYTSQRNLRWDNLDIIATVMASISGVGEDPLMNRFKADRAPAFLGTRFQRPDGIDSDALAMAISAAITEKGLDPLVEFLLDEEHRRTDGAVKWSEYAETIFKLSPDGAGWWAWDMVERSTRHLDRARKAQGDAARKWVRSLFEWLPGFIVSVVDSFDPHFIGWSSTGQRAVMASDFELFYLSEPSEVRQPLTAALRYGSVEEAAQALVEHLADLHTGSELVESVVFA